MTELAKKSVSDEKKESREREPAKETEEGLSLFQREKVNQRGGR